MATATLSRSDVERVVRDVLRQIFEVMLANAPGVRADIDPEFLHDLRVAVRRTRSVLGQVRGVLDEAAVAAFAERFRWLGEVTGPTRDLDVLLLDLPALLAELDPGDALALAPLVALVREQRAEAWGALAADLDGPRWTSIVDDWGPYYTKRIKAVADGNWEQIDIWGGMKDGHVVMAPYTNMPDDVKAAAEEAQAKITSGELNPFTGPIKKQDGSEWLKAGEVAEDGVLLGLNFYVAGVDDKLPQ